MERLPRNLLEHIQRIENRYEELNRIIEREKLEGRRFAEVMKERAEMEEVLSSYREYESFIKEYEELKSLSEEAPELKEEVKKELERISGEIERVSKKIKELLIPKDPMDNRNVILEIRAGAGGEEASLFAGDLLRMYMRFAERKGWETEILSTSTTGLKGYKEVIVLIKGKGAYSTLKYESGVHRVQRVPITEASGRIHTSTCTVAVLPEADEVDLKISHEELKIETFRASGHGGQHVNKTESAVRITHIPTGISVHCQDEKSQHRNKARALKILYARLREMMEAEKMEKISSLRRSQVGRAERSEKIRTYNFPQNRVTDHRIEWTSYDLKGFLDGEIDEVLNKLKDHFNAMEIEKLSSNNS
jgi:peptide chain release factor 1